MFIKTQQPGDAQNTVNIAKPEQLLWTPTLSNILECTTIKFYNSTRDFATRVL